MDINNRYFFLCCFAEMGVGPSYLKLSFPKETCGDLEVFVSSAGEKGNLSVCLSNSVQEHFINFVKAMALKVMFLLSLQ